MAVMLPAQASALLNELGLEWPEGNEDKILDYSHQWGQYGNRVSHRNAESTWAVNAGLAVNQGPGMQAFKENFSGAEGQQDVQQKLAQAGNLIGGCSTFMATVITALKIAFVVNLVATVVSIAATVAAAVASGGIASGFIVAAKEICKKLLDMAINLATTKLLDD